MNRFIRKIALLFVSAYGCFNSAPVLGANNLPIMVPAANVDPLSQARSKCSELLDNGENPRIIFYSDNNESPNSCFIMGGHMFLMWNANRQTCQWIHCRTLVTQLLQDNLDCIWDASQFSNLGIEPLSETEFSGFIESFPSMNNLVNRDCHRNTCNHEHQAVQPVEQQYPN